MSGESYRGSLGARIAGYIVSLLPCAGMTLSAFMKFTRPPSVLEGFAKFGYDKNLLIPIAITEIACVILYLIPQTAVLGAILMTGYLGGAVATHARVHDPAFIMPALLGALAWLGLLLRDRRIRALLPFRKI